MAVITPANRSNPSALQPQLPQGCVVVTPSDTDTFAFPVAIYIGGTAGNIVVTPANGAANVTLAVAANSIVPFMVKAVLSTNTTATPIHAIY